MWIRVTVALTWILLFLTCVTNAEQQTSHHTSSLPSDPMMATPQGEKAAETSTKACQDEIRHCNQLLAQRDQNCADAKRESSQQCDKRVHVVQETLSHAHESQMRNMKEQWQIEARECEKRVFDALERGKQEAQTRCDQELTAQREANRQTRTAHQAEVKYLSSIIDKMRARQESSEGNCEKRVSESYHSAWKEMELRYEEQLTATKEAAAQSRQAHQAEVQKLASLISQLEQNQESKKNDCERRVSEAYARGWQEVEAEYEEQVTASKEAMAQSRMAHQNEVQKLTSVINQLEERGELKYADCERKVSEAYTRGRQELEAQYEEEVTANKETMAKSRMEHQQEVQRLTSVISQLVERQESKHVRLEHRLAAQERIEQLESRLSLARTSAKLRIDYLIDEKERLERDNRARYQHLLRTQLLLLETQEELAEANNRLKTKWMFGRAADAVAHFTGHVWESFLADQAKMLWELCVRTPWEKYGSPLWQLTQVHAPLVVGLVADVTRTIFTEVALFFRDLPETIPQAMEDIWNALDFLRMEAMELLHRATLYLWGRVEAAMSAAWTKIAPAYYKFVEELHLEELDPHIQAVKKQMNSIQESLAPYLEQLGRSCDGLKRYFRDLLQRIKQDFLEIAIQVHAYFKARMKSLGDRKALLVKDFGLAARTVFLFLQVYRAPKFILDPAEQCYQQPGAALWSVLKFSMGVLVLRLLWRLFFSVKRKRLPQRKVKFALTQ